MFFYLFREMLGRDDRVKNTPVVWFARWEDEDSTAGAVKGRRAGTSLPLRSEAQIGWNVLRKGRPWGIHKGTEQAELCR